MPASAGGTGFRGSSSATSGVITPGRSGAVSTSRSPQRPNGGPATFRTATQGTSTSTSHRLQQERPRRMPAPLQRGDRLVNDIFVADELDLHLFKMAVIP